MLIKTMTTTERSEFKAHVLGKDEQQKISTNMLSRETSPHTNPTITAVPPSRETGPHIAQSTKRLAEVLKRFRKPNQPHTSFTMMIRRVTAPCTTPKNQKAVKPD